ncbi:hypothetical protein LO763_11640 [Glycomyces sp. A-F 0318]|uniref:hypothetical protein n=1 Tax=Glycomyces amatae TaxID=2881355 RepID=UPI001E48E81E|nr:hypothetical protein [Glycomyces amatae]MCD0444274.1 hypothetical protein [Glycomyces amatae]
MFDREGVIPTPDLRLRRFDLGSGRVEPAIVGWRISQLCHGEPSSLCGVLVSGPLETEAWNLEVSDRPQFCFQRFVAGLSFATGLSALHKAF